MPTTFSSWIKHLHLPDSASLICRRIRDGPDRPVAPPSVPGSGRIRIRAADRGLFTPVKRSPQGGRGGFTVFRDRGVSLLGTGEIAWRVRKLALRLQARPVPPIAATSDAVWRLARCRPRTMPWQTRGDRVRMSARPVA